jgi:hypothetical protein
MNLIDPQGRLFGRVNLVDAAIGAFVALLIPLGIAAVLLFRPPSPVITNVEPAPLTMTEDRAAQGSVLGGKVKVRGTGLRPVLRAEIGGRQALAFIFEDPTAADVLFGDDVPPGTHDIVLYDGVQEVARAHRAVTIPEPLLSGGTSVRLVGTFLAMPEGAAHDLRVGGQFPAGAPPAVEILALGDLEPARYSVDGQSEIVVAERWQRSAMVSARCDVPPFAPRECRADRVLLGAGQVFSIPGTAGSLRLLIDQVLPDSDPVAAELRVRFVAYPSVLDLVQIGDADRAHWSIDQRNAVIASLGARRTAMGSVSLGVFQEGGSVSGEVQTVDQMGVVDAVVRLGLDATERGWRYRTDSVRVGAPITFSTRAYTVRGIVLSITPRDPGSGFANGATR